MKNDTKKLIVSIAIFGVAFFVVSSAVVFAQGFIGPSQEAPTGNVLDFLSASSDAQGRLGKLRIGSDVIPSDPLDPYVDVLGNVHLQGNASVTSGEASSTMFVSNGTIPTFVGAGTTVPNGKLNIQGYLSYGLYAASTNNYGIYVQSSSGGVESPIKAIFGQTLQVAGGEISSGVKGETNAANGAAVFGWQQNCPDVDVTSCGYAAQFVGNVVVTGNIQGDGRGVFKTWTLNDTSSTSSGTGIAIKTVDFFTEDFVGATAPIQELNVLAATEKFIAMSILVNGEPYDPSRAALPADNDDFLNITFDTDPSVQGVVIERDYDVVPSDLNIVVLVYYQQSLSVNITDVNDNPISVQNALVGSTTPITFKGSVGGGFGGGEFVWTLHTDAAGTSPDCQEAASGDCGQLLVGTEQYTVYIPPASLPASGNRVYLKATWTSDPGLYSLPLLEIDLYDIQFTSTPVNDFVYIGGSATLLEATADCPDVCPPLTFTFANPASAFGTLNSGGLYTSPLAMGVGTAWTETIRAVLDGLPGDLYRDYQLQLLPQIIITATNPGQAAGLTSSWTSNAEVGTGQTLQLVAEAQNIPDVYKYNFTWEIVDPYDASETVYNSIELPTQTNGDSEDNKNIQYTAPATVNTTIAQQRHRQVRATWMANGLPTASSQVLDIYPGRGPILPTTFSRTVSTTGSHSLKVSGFHSERDLYSFCGLLDCANEQVIDYANLPLTISSTTLGSCGTLQFTGMATDLGCDPVTQSCELNANFTYTAKSTTCTSPTFQFKLRGDSREYGTLRTTSTGGSCVCNPKTGYCCGPSDGDAETPGGLF